MHVGDVLCLMLGINDGLDALACRFDQQTITDIGLTDVDLQTIIADFAAELQNVEKLIF